MTAAQRHCSLSAQRILIDGFFLGKPYGFGRFLLELCGALGQAKTDIQFFVAVPADVDPSLLASYPNVVWHRMKNYKRIVWEQVMVPRLAKHLSCDIIHFPCNTNALFTYGIETVTTIHDLIFMQEKFPVWKFREFIKGEYIKYSVRHFARRSKSVISVSRMTQRMLDEIGISSTVIYNTASGFISQTHVDAFSTCGRRYLLHRGGTAVHRNTRRVIDAFISVCNEIPDVDLKILGVPSAYAAQWGILDKPRIELLPRLSDKDLASLYLGSSGVIVASLQEGFGLPIIEAFGFRVPVITSNIDPMKEIADDSAILVNPLNISEISGAMIQILTKPDIARSLTWKGSERVKLFAADVMASKLIDVYESQMINH